MNPYEIIYQNFSHCTEYRDDSFLGILHEQNRLDMNEYWKLEWSLVKLTQNEVDYQRNLSWPAFRIYSYGMRLLQADVDSNNGYKICDFDLASNYEFTERFQLVFEGFFRGDPPDLKLAFDERNPLLE